MAKYDTAEIRRAAGVVAEGRSEMAATVTAPLRISREGASDRLKGRAAEALSGRMADLDREARNIEGMLDQLHDALMSFAQSLDDADRELAGI